MVHNISPKDAARSLADIGNRQARLIDEVLVPGWYWWMVAVLTVVLGVAVDSHRPGLAALVTVVYAVLVAGVTVWMIWGRNRARVRSQLLGDRGAVAIVGFVWVVVGLSLGFGFALRTADVGHPATLACLVCAVGLIVGGPGLMSYLRHTMLKRRAV
jgi:hypothetical protein